MDPEVCRGPRDAPSGLASARKNGRCTGMDEVVHLIVDGRPSRDVPVSPGVTLAPARFRAGGFIGRPLWSGIERCGLCRVRFVTGRSGPGGPGTRVAFPGPEWRRAGGSPAPMPPGTFPGP
jgi:hypothetical protein